MERKQQEWTSRFGFILSSAGAAIGLGAIWRLPYVTGTSGGGAFFLLFVVFTLLIGLPMLVAEFIIGRGTGLEAVSAYKKIAPKSLWVWIGRLGVLGSFLLLSFYSVVGGWVLIYAGKSIGNQIIGVNVEYDALFGSVVGSPLVTIMGLLLFTIINVLVISLGIQNGIERMNKYMMPLLFLFFIIIVIRALTLDGAMEGVQFFLAPDFSSIDGEAILYALGQSFFSLAVGFSAMVTYSSYLDKKVSITTSATWVVSMNIFVSLLAGLAIFPVVFAFGLAPDHGPSLLFIVLPEAFAQMPLGSLFLSLFLILFLFATLTSSFSLYEVIVAAFTKNSKRSRESVSLILGIVLFIIAIPAALSSSLLTDFTIFGLSVFDATDYFVSNILLPLGAFMIALFIIHKMDKSLVKSEFTLGSNLSPVIYSIWRFLMTIVLPFVILFVYLNLLGII